MSFKLRYLLVAVSNCALLFGFLYVSIDKGWDLSRRLIDINLTQKQDATILFTLLGLLLVTLVVNVVLFSYRRKDGVSEREARNILDSLQRNGVLKVS
jgi:hypothetical protein